MDHDNRYRYMALISYVVAQLALPSTMSTIAAASRSGNIDSRGGRRSFLSFTTACRVLSACIILVSLQNFVHLSRLTSSSVHTPSFNGVINNDITVAPVLFTPEEFQAGRIEKYINQPTIYTPQRDDQINQLISKSVPPPSETLLHQAPLPPSNNAILGLASYPRFQEGWVRLVGSLRRNGYEGHIILGVHPEIPGVERDYLDKMGVTYYAVETTNCTSAILPQNYSPQTSNTVRAKCSRGLEHFKLEWGRYEMARRWLKACDTCTGWSMVIDTRDIFFQADPFVSLGSVHDAEQDLMFVEEVAQYSKTLNDTSRAINIGASHRYKYFTVPCYGRDQVAPQRIIDRPMLCSGTVIGTRSGIHRFLTVLVDEFNNNNQKGVDECRSPHTTDQWTMNYLYYRGDFGFPHRTKTLPWGTGPVLTVGKPCASQLYNNATGKMEHVKSLKDMMVFDSDTDLIVNPHEKKGSATYVAPTIHQWDRCLKWMNPWFSRHEELFWVEDGGVEWVKG